jgi:hypothetical protein
MMINAIEGKNKKQVKDDIVSNRLPRKAPLIKGFTKFLGDHLKSGGFCPANPMWRTALGSKRVGSRNE